MRMGDELISAWFEKGKNIRRASWPKGDYISVDGAEGGTLWYYTAEEDELTPDYKLGFHEIAAGDWEYTE